MATSSHSLLFTFRQRGVVNTILTTALALVVLVTFIAPLGYMFTSALKSYDQISDPSAPWYWPFSRKTFGYEGKQLELFMVPVNGVLREMAALKKTNAKTTFIDPQNPTAEPVVYQGSWRRLSPLYVPDAQWQNFKQAWDQVNFPRLFLNSFIIAGFGTIGAVCSSVLVSYGFSRFKFRGKGVLFLVLIGTIILPVQATLIPTYLVFAKIHWTNTFLPLIVPHFFANAYNVFLLRQYFMQIPRELDEAAMMDGASPLRILFSVIIPQSIPAVTAVSLFHFFFAWNDFFTPLVYLASKPELWPISVGLQKFNALYGRLPNLLQMGALIALILPVVIFFFAQRVFMQGIVFTGVEK
jgi:multiple sugar transport system permease protein